MSDFVPGCQNRKCKRSIKRNLMPKK